MPKMHISKSIVINSTAERIYQTLSDFNEWPSWSPWLIMDPEAQVTVAEDTKSYKWEGTRVGSGNMKITHEEKNKAINYDLNFLTPFKSRGDVRFELEEEGNTTKVTWIMDSALPFFMFFMKKMMEAFVGADYERGLHMLKAKIEEGEVPSTLDFLGESDFNGCKYVGIQTTCRMDEVGKQMEDDFIKIWSYARDLDNMVGDAFTIYHKWDFAKNQVSYTSGVPVIQLPDDLKEGFVSGDIPATKMYTIEHTGPYLHLGNAWSTLYGMQRGKEFKSNKKIDPFETYLNSPEKTPAKELVTQVHFPIK